MTLRLRLLYIGLFITLFVISVIGNGGQVASSQSVLTSQNILGRWRVFDHPQSGISVPHSFFWASMEHIEFREDGTVLALIPWPPDGGSDIRLNASAQYALVDDQQIAFTGSCRYQGPCTGVYTATLNGNTLRIFGASGKLTLAWIDPPGKDLPPTVVGPQPSPTPAAKN